MTDLSSYSGVKVLVTGGSGFIGSMLCDRLCSLDANVHSVSRGRQSTINSCISWHQGDLADSRFVSNLFQAVEPDIVYHLASEVKGGRDLALVLPTLSANLISTVNMLVAASETRCRRIVLAGSLEEPDTDEANVIPSSPYAAAKWASSAYARMFYVLYQTPVVLARLFMVYGPGQKDLKKLIPYVTLSLLRGEIPHLASGTRQVDWVYVMDIVRGLLMMGLASDIDGSIIELGSGEMATTREVVENLRKIINPEAGLEFGALSDRAMEQVRVANIGKTYEQIGWQPEYSLSEGLEETVQWYERQLEQGIIKI